VGANVKRISYQSVPKRDFRVRRRRNGDVVWLYFDNYAYMLDERTDATWRACDGHRTVSEVARVVGDELGEPTERAEVIAASACAMFIDNGLLVAESCEPTATQESR
jgi:hypothetical protein